MRIAAHPIIESYNKGKLVTFTLDGKELTGYEGESIAAALKAAGVMVHRQTAQTQRHLLCDREMHGLCHDCQRRAQCADMCNTPGGRDENSDAIWCRAEKGGLTK